MRERTKYIYGLLALMLVIVITGCGRDAKVNGNQVHLTNVSYDTTRELYEDYNKWFHEVYLKDTGLDVTVTQSHGGSSGQGRSVLEGNDADVVTLGSEQDVNILSRIHLLNPNWIEQLPEHSAPYTSTIVFLVRHGNPKNIHDWNDLTAKGIKIIAPDPKSSSAAQWIFLGAWDYGLFKYQSEAGAKSFVHDLYANVAVMDSGSRGSTTTFVENKQGDVLLVWENEAIHIMKQYPHQYELIAPSRSVLAEPSVAVVEKLTNRAQTTQVAYDYLNYLYKEKAQHIIAEHGFRPRNQAVLRLYSSEFNQHIHMTSIEEMGGWKAVQEKFFDDGKIFDEIYGS